MIFQPAQKLPTASPAEPKTAGGAVDFQAFFAAEIAPRAADFERERIQQKTKKQAYLVVLALIWAAATVVLLLNLGKMKNPGQAFGIVFSLVGLMLLAVYHFGFQAPFDRWRTGWKSIFFERIFEAATGRQGRFFPRKGHLEEDLNRSQLFSNKAKTCRSEDFFELDAGGAGIEFSEILEAKNDVGKDGFRFFRGLFLVADAPKSFAATTVVLPKNDSPSGHFQQIRLENRDFSALFDVFTTDEIEARRLLSPAFQERVLAVRAITATVPRLSFSDGKIWAAFASDAVFFELPLAENTWESERFEKNFETVRVIFSLLSALKIGDLTFPAAEKDEILAAPPALREARHSLAETSYAMRGTEMVGHLLTVVFCAFGLGPNVFSGECIEVFYLFLVVPAAFWLLFGWLAFGTPEPSSKGRQNSAAISFLASAAWAMAFGGVFFRKVGWPGGWPLGFSSVGLALLAVFLAAGAAKKAKLRHFAGTMIVRGLVFAAVGLLFLLFFRKPC